MRPSRQRGTHCPAGGPGSFVRRIDARQADGALAAALAQEKAPRPPRHDLHVVGRGAVRPAVPGPPIQPSPRRSRRRRAGPARRQGRAGRAAGPVPTAGSRRTRSLAPAAASAPRRAPAFGERGPRPSGRGRGREAPSPAGRGFSARLRCRPAVIDPDRIAACQPPPATDRRSDARAAAADPVVNPTCARAPAVSACACA